MSVLTFNYNCYRTKRGFPFVTLVKNLTVKSSLYSLYLLTNLKALFSPILPLSSKAVPYCSVYSLSFCM